MASEPIDILDQAERLERAGDHRGVAACLKLAAEQDPAVAEDLRYQAISERLDLFLSRRVLLRAALGLAGLTLTGATAAAGLAYLLPPDERLSVEDTLLLGAEADFPPDGWKMVEFRGRPILVVRDALGSFHALSAVCTHSDVCVVQWAPETQEVVCPCHRATFDLQGNVIEGPPPRPLPLFEVRVFEGNVYLKTS